MGQAKARGSKEQRVLEAVERINIAAIATQARQVAERKARDEAAIAAQIARDADNAARLERGEPQLPQYVHIGQRKARLSTLLAIAGIGMMLR